MKKSLIIGIGNGFRRDDGVGLEIARSVEEKDLPGVSVVKSTGDISDLIPVLREYDTLIIADSIKASGNPGMNIRIDISELDEDFELSANISTHWLGILDSLKMAKNTYGLPAKTVIFGIEGLDYSYGTGISPELFGAINFILGEIIDELTA